MIWFLYSGVRFFYLLWSDIIKCFDEEMFGEIIVSLQKGSIVFLFC